MKIKISPLILKTFRFITKTRRRFITTILLILLAWVRITGFPLIPLIYGFGMLPVRTIQYTFSSDQEIAGKLLRAANYKSPGLLKKLGMWAAYRELKRVKFSKRDQALALAIVSQESSFRPFARNPRSSACGLYQFIIATGRSHGLSRWKCMDAVANATAGIEIVRKYRSAFSKVRAKKTFILAAKCYYLNHYYGIRSACTRDPKGIWKVVGPRLLRDAGNFKKVLG